jgi:hypothetical protein
MKPVGYCLLGLALAVSSVAETAPAAPRISARLAQEIRASLPAFSLPTHPPPSVEPERPRDPDILELPKMQILEKRLPRIAPDQILTGPELGKKMKREYLNSLGEVSQLNRILNSFYIPLFSAPVSVRAHAAYMNKQTSEEMSRLAHTIDVVEKLDPKEAARLRQALNHDPDER